jgi:hypothetical protein
MATMNQTQQQRHLDRVVDDYIRCKYDQKLRDLMKKLAVLSTGSLSWSEVHFECQTIIEYLYLAGDRVANSNGLPTTMTLAKRGRAHGDSGQEEGRLSIPIIETGIHGVAKCLPKKLDSRSTRAIECCAGSISSTMR